MLEKSIDLEQEPNGKIAPFRMNEFVEDMSHDFTEQTAGEPFFLKESMLDEFIDKYIPIGLEELQSIQGGKFILQAYDYAWLRKR